MDNSVKPVNCKMAFFCSYTPVEVITACGLVPCRIFPSEEKTVFDSRLHPTLCSFVRGVFEQLQELGDESFKGAVVLNSCHAMSHFYHALEAYASFPFFYFMHLPRDNTSEAQEFFAREILKFYHKLASYTGIEALEDKLWEQIELYRQNRKWLQDIYENRASLKESERLKLSYYFMVTPPQEFSRLSTTYTRENLTDVESSSNSSQPSSYPRLFICGSLLSFELVKLIEDMGGNVVGDDLCLGQRVVDFSPEYFEGTAQVKDPYFFLSQHYLSKNRCARMKHSVDEINELKLKFKKLQVDGVILFYLKFCEPWYYYGQVLKENIAKETPLLVLEEEYNIKSSKGQLRTRISAFMEMLCK